MLWAIFIALCSSLLATTECAAGSSPWIDMPLDVDQKVLLNMDCKSLFERSNDIALSGVLRFISVTGNNWIEFTTVPACSKAFSSRCHLLGRKHMLELLSNDQGVIEEEGKCHQMPNAVEGDGRMGIREKFQVLSSIGCVQSLVHWELVTMEHVPELIGVLRVSQLRHWMEFDPNVLEALLMAEYPNSASGEERLVSEMPVLLGGISISTSFEGLKRILESDILSKPTLLNGRLWMVVLSSELLEQIHLLRSTIQLTIGNVLLRLAEKFETKTSSLVLWQLRVKMYLSSMDNVRLDPSKSRRVSVVTQSLRALMESVDSRLWAQYRVAESIQIDHQSSVSRDSEQIAPTACGSRSSPVVDEQKKKKDASVGVVQQDQFLSEYVQSGRLLPLSMCSISQFELALTDAKVPAHLIFRWMADFLLQSIHVDVSQLPLTVSVIDQLVGTTAIAMAQIQSMWMELERSASTASLTRLNTGINNRIRVASSSLYWMLRVSSLRTLKEFWTARTTSSSRASTCIMQDGVFASSLQDYWEKFVTMVESHSEARHALVRFVKSYELLDGLSFFLVKSSSELCQLIANEQARISGRKPSLNLRRKEPGHTTMSESEGLLEMTVQHVVHRLELLAHPETMLLVDGAIDMGGPMRGWIHDMLSVLAESERKILVPLKKAVSDDGSSSLGLEYRFAWMLDEVVGLFAGAMIGKAIQQYQSMPFALDPKFFEMIMDPEQLEEQYYQETYAVEEEVELLNERMMYKWGRETYDTIHEDTLTYVSPLLLRLTSLFTGDGPTNLYEAEVDHQQGHFSESLVSFDDDDGDDDEAENGGGLKKHQRPGWPVYDDIPLLHADFCRIGRLSFSRFVKKFIAGLEATVNLKLLQRHGRLGAEALVNVSNPQEMPVDRLLSSVRYCFADGDAEQTVESLIPGHFITPQLVFETFVRALDRVQLGKFVALWTGSSNILDMQEYRPTVSFYTPSQGSGNVLVVAEFLSPETLERLQRIGQRSASPNAASAEGESSSSSATLEEGRQAGVDGMDNGEECIFSVSRRDDMAVMSSMVRAARPIAGILDDDDDDDEGEEKECEVERETKDADDSIAASEVGADYSGPILIQEEAFVAVFMAVAEEQRQLLDPTSEPHSYNPFDASRPTFHDGRGHPTSIASCSRHMSVPLVSAGQMIYALLLCLNMSVRDYRDNV